MAHPFRDPFPRILASCLLILAISVALGSCGRRGSPEPPPSASVISTDEYGNAVDQSEEPVDQPEEPVDRPFILDPLLQ